MGDLLWQDLHDQLAEHQGRHAQNGLRKRSRAGTTPGIDLDNEDNEDLEGGSKDDGVCFAALPLDHSSVAGLWARCWFISLFFLFSCHSDVPLDDYLESHKKKKVKQEPRKRKEISNIVCLHSPVLSSRSSKNIFADWLLLHILCSFLHVLFPSRSLSFSSPCPAYFGLNYAWQAREEDINLPAHHDLDMMECEYLFFLLASSASYWLFTFPSPKVDNNDIDVSSPLVQAIRQARKLILYFIT